MSFFGLLNQSISIVRYGSAETGFHGEPKSDSETITVQARVENTDKEVVDVNGREAFSKARIFLPAGTNVTREDRIVLEGNEMEILNIEKVIIGGGDVHHIELLIGETSRGG